MFDILGACFDQKVLQKRLINDLIVWGPCLHARAPPVFESLCHKINDQLGNISKQFHSVVDVTYTTSYATLRAADLDWIVGPGYSSGGYILGCS